MGFSPLAAGTALLLFTTAAVAHTSSAPASPAVSVSSNSATEVSSLLGPLATDGGGSNSEDASASPTKKTNFVRIGQDEKLSSNVVGLDVYNTSNQDIGQIKDIALGPAGGTGAYIVSVGGFLGMGTRYVAVNSSDIQVSYSGTDQKWHAHTSATSDELKSAPEFQYNGRWNASCGPQ